MNHTVRRHIFSCLIALLVCTLIPGCRTEDEKPSAAPRGLSALPQETTPAGATVLSDHAVILIGKAALPLFHQCSRANPQGVTGYWTPTAQDIAHLEADAPAFLQSQKIPATEFFSRDCRQYARIIQKGRKIVYVNVVPPGFLRMFIKIGRPVDWRHKAVVVCDGGPSFFGMEYDVQARRFQHLSFNGVA